MLEYLIAGLMLDESSLNVPSSLQIEVKVDEAIKSALESTF